MRLCNNMFWQMNKDGNSGYPVRICELSAEEKEKKDERCGWRGYEREEKEGEREVDNLSTWGCVIQLYLRENTQFIKIREFGWGFLMLTS